MLTKSTAEPKKMYYSLSQILLHWLVALLVFYQLTTSGDIQETYKTFLNTGEWPSYPSNKTLLHIIFGFLIVFGMILRVYLRVKTKVPKLPPRIPLSLKLLAISSHFSLYFFLFLMPISGVLGWYWELKFSITIHTVSSKILLALILFHICAVFFHEGVLGNKILNRMLQHKNNSKR